LVGIRIHFGRMCISHAEYITRKFYASHLHTEAYSEERNFIFPCIAYGIYLSFYAAATKARCYKHRIELLHFFGGIVGSKVFGMNVLYFYFTLIERTGMNECFENRFVSILQLHIFSDQPNGNFRFRVTEFV